MAETRLRYSTQSFAFLCGGSGSMGIKVAWFDYSTAGAAAAVRFACLIKAHMYSRTFWCLRTFAQMELVYSALRVPMAGAA
jgi:hypothetical protein